ncbi:hypothetical protein CMUS01_09885 [Colletotrichum musicola]|uniref:Uncharacterized protein n=1 Tax=Colletotrichum musicola TaxID=2175873 RepID=A0A8H6K544_9PEZI|nr:hypothetical protein CMUS01_09885 [Colletotrichum musicola]
MLSFGKSSATEWSQFQQPPQPLDEGFQAVDSNLPPALHSCFCVDQHLGVTYIDEAEFLQIFREVLGGDTSNAAKVALTYSALSISSSRSTERSFSTPKSNSLAQAYYREGLNATEKLYTMAPSVLTFKVFSQ